MSANDSSRDLAIDRFRGLLVILMVIGNYLSGIAFVPGFLKHPDDIGFTIADTVAPAFVFVIGLTYGSSFARRSQIDLSAAYRHFMTRYLSILGIGAVISAGSNLVGTPTDWGVLQSLGVAGIITLAFIRLNRWVRLIVGLAILIGYQFVLDTSMLEIVLESNHGGFFGSISWAALLILSTVFADFWKKGIRSYIFLVSMFAVAALLAAFVVPVSKHRVSLSFILISVVISALVVVVANTIARYVPDRPGLLCWWGERALALYLLHLIVLSLFVTPDIDWWYVDAPVWLAALQLIFTLAALSYVARMMHKSGARKKLASQHSN